MRKLKKVIIITEPVAKFLGRSGLADSRLAHHHGQPAVPGDGVLQGRTQLVHLPLAANEYPACLPGIGHGSPDL